MDGIEHQADAIIFATGFDLEVMMMIEMMMMMIVMMMVMMIMTIMMEMVIIRLMSRQARSPIPKKGWKGSWLRTMGMHHLLTWVV